MILKAIFLRLVNSKYVNNFQLPLPQGLIDLVHLPNNTYSLK